MYSEKFLKAVKEIEENNTLNIYVAEAIEKRVDYKTLKKEIKLAIKIHRKYDAQPGSSPMHIAVVMAMTRLLDMLEHEEK
jgi:hypothetical protein